MARPCCSRKWEGALVILYHRTRFRSPLQNVKSSSTPRRLQFCVSVAEIYKERTFPTTSVDSVYVQYHVRLIWTNQFGGEAYSYLMEARDQDHDFETQKREFVSNSAKYRLI
jgi:hypothetical protein